MATDPELHKSPMVRPAGVVGVGQSPIRKEGGPCLLATFADIPSPGVQSVVIPGAE